MPSPYSLHTLRSAGCTQLDARGRGQRKDLEKQMKRSRLEEVLVEWKGYNMETNLTGLSTWMDLEMEREKSRMTS